MRQRSLRTCRVQGRPGSGPKSERGAPCRIAACLPLYFDGLCTIACAALGIQNGSSSSQQQQPAAAAKHTAILGMRDSGKTYRYTRHAWQRQSIPLYSDSTQSKHRGIIWSRRHKRVCDKKRFPCMSIQNSLPLPRYNATRRSILPAQLLQSFLYVPDSFF